MRDVAIENVEAWMSSTALSVPANAGSADLASIANIWQFTLDPDMIVVSLTAPGNGLEMVGFPCGRSPLGRQLTDIVTIERNVSAVIEFNSAFRAQEPIRNARFVCNRDSDRLVLINGTPFWNDQGEFAGYHCTACDITSANGVAAEMNDYEVILGAFIRHVPNLVTVKDIEGKYLAINPLGERTFGLPRAKMMGKRPSEVLPADIAAECAKDDLEVLESEMVREVEQMFPGPDGARYFHTVKFPIFDNDRYLVGIGAIGVDITEYKRTEDGLYRRANFDNVTGLPNRQLMTDRLENAMALARRANTAVGVIVFDLGDFTAINEGMGHIAGDWLLIDVASTVKSLVRDTDTVCRLDGDVFAVIAPNLKSAEELDLVAAKILATLQQPRVFMDEEVFIQPSIGTAFGPSDANQAKELIHCAKMALDVAKDAGRGKISRFKPAISGAFVRRMKVESQMRHAVERGELQLAYQPIVDVKSGDIVSAEALLRWKNDDLGAVSPAEFIPLAEETGLINGIGEWVIRQACADAKRLNPAGAKPLVVAINVSVKQLGDPRIVEIVGEALKDANLAPHLLKIEMTESAFADDQHRFQAAVEGFRNLGVTVALDDFGTGYSSLSYLHRYRFDQLKIDKSFIDNITARGDGYLLVENIVRMAHSLRLDLVAEGVETQEQVEMLKDLGCDKFQGYLVSKPIACAAFESLLADRREARMGALAA